MRLNAGSRHWRRAIERVRRRWLSNLFAALFRGGAESERLPGAGIHRILLIRPNHRLGNTLLLTPLVDELERAYPGAEIDILTAGPAAADVFRGFESVRHVFALPAKVVRHLPRLFGLLRYLRRSRYDLAIDPSKGSGSSRLLLLFARANHKLGFVGARTYGRLTCGIAAPGHPQHMAQQAVYLLRAARGEGVEGRFPRLDIRLSGAERCQGQERLRHLFAPESPDGPVIGLYGTATGAKAYGPAWWTALIEYLAAALPAARFVEMVPADGVSRFGDRFPAYFSTSVRAMAGVMAAMDCVVSADCGVMHLACASGATTVGAFKVTDSQRYGPYGDGNVAIDADDRSAQAVAEAALHALHSPAQRTDPAPDTTRLTAGTRPTGRLR